MCGEISVTTSAIRSGRSSNSLPRKLLDANNRRVDMTAVQCRRIVRNGRLEAGAFVAAFLAMAACARGQSSAESHPPASHNRSAAVNDFAEVSRFVQGFLDWYVPIAVRDESV